MSTAPASHRIQRSGQDFPIAMPYGCCRIGVRKGRIAPGFDADLLAVHGNPLTDIAALRAVRAVFRAGRRVR